ncbi:MAG TPA: MOSC domain-containing protein [Acidobacteriaceae bacterium]|jgi:MOSC domain-containing protein YiiM|nr:MOSC domain-containing protein [Acidobacteriaceae bacterium]
MPDAVIEAVFAGSPKLISDRHGVWTSSILRDRVKGPIRVGFAGLAGDRVTQPYHGGPGAAVCVHPSAHYEFWNRTLGMQLAPGSVGENLTLHGLGDEDVFAGDIVRAGTVLMQVSGPRIPCANQARRVDRSDWIRLTIQENRTGFYLRVLEPGSLQEGDGWQPQDRLNEDASIAAINRCAYLAFDGEYAQRILEMRGLEPWWKEQMQEKLSRERGHWTETMAGETVSSS